MSERVKHTQRKTETQREQENLLLVVMSLVLPYCLGSANENLLQCSFLGHSFDRVLEERRRKRKRVRNSLLPYKVI